MKYKSISNSILKVNKRKVLVTWEGSTFWKFLTTEITRSETSDLSRKDPLTSSVEKRRRTALKATDKRPVSPPAAEVGFRGTEVTFTFRYLRKTPLAAITDNRRNGVVRETVGIWGFRRFSKWENREEINAQRSLLCS